MTRPDPCPAYTRSAVTAMIRALDAEHDFAGWLADVLARVAAVKGSSGALTAGRPGSWEAGLLDQLVKGTVGYDDEYLLPDPGPARAKTRDGPPVPLSGPPRDRRQRQASPRPDLRSDLTARRRQGGDPREAL